ncbi:MAG: hypothetical protein CSA74_10660 [Rhodobacterales bacterium]|nr:MAG: hypothetical protein CSA74_10660 [Rhodobacterales bacterium]
MRDTPERNGAGARALPLTAVAAAVAVFTGLVVATISTTGGVFEYPLDDTYIHLALAEQIAQGNYGINAGERAAPGSSLVFPLLLTPFAGQPFQRYLPVLWSLVGLVGAAWIWGRLLFEAGYGRREWRWFGLAAAALVPTVLQLPQVAFLGMEHTLHTAGALLVVLGLYRYLTGTGATRGAAVLVIVGALIGSAFRLEAMALGLLAGGVLFFTGQRLFGALAWLAALLPVVLFSAVLLSLGLEAMPSSVHVKLAQFGQLGDDRLIKRLASVIWNMSQPGGYLLGVFSSALLVLPLFLPGLRASRLKLLSFTLGAAGVAHLLAGQIGWLRRYENYALIVTAVGLLVVLAPVTKPATPRLPVAAALTAMLAAGLFAYPPGSIKMLPGGAHTILVQQGEMARFAQDYLDAPVAVNDIGRVAWANPNFVLDLWGLASEEARRIRLNHRKPGWAGRLTAARNVPVAMVYDNWIKDGIGADWVRIGQLDLNIPRYFLGGDSVAFYATSPDQVDMLRGKLAEWVPTLRRGVQFVWEEGMAP